MKLDPLRVSNLTIIYTNLPESVNHDIDQAVRQADGQAVDNAIHKPFQSHLGWKTWAIEN